MEFLKQAGTTIKRAPSLMQLLNKCETYCVSFDCALKGRTNQCNHKISKKQKIITVS